MLVNLGPKWQNKIINTDHIAIIEPDRVWDNGSGEIRIHLFNGNRLVLCVNAPNTVDNEIEELKQLIGMKTP